MQSVHMHPVLERSKYALSPLKRRPARAAPLESVGYGVVSDKARYVNLIIKHMSGVWEGRRGENAGEKPRSPRGEGGGSLGA